MTASTWDIVFRDSSRFWVQHVLMPIVVIVGLMGNIINIIILTRRNIRSSSNIYLTALAFSDLIFLLFSFTMSWKHYEYMENIWFYWNYIPIGLWITDASCSTSIWLTVAFTFERYIAVCHPMIGKAHCTENRAKTVAFVVYIVCFLLTASTSFEWKSVAKLSTELLSNSAENNTGENWESVNIVVTGYMLKNTDLGESTLYRFLYHWMTIIIFAIIPFCLLSILNFLLIIAVRKSTKARESMTSTHLQYRLHLQSIRQEERITVILIAVVIMFLVCQLPTAAVLIYTALNNEAKSESLEENVLLGLGNIFNFLVCINAACNFLLYTALSENYRKIFVNIILCNFDVLKQSGNVTTIPHNPNCRLQEIV